jgi:hypothetical protein
VCVREFMFVCGCCLCLCVCVCVLVFVKNYGFCLFLVFAIWVVGVLGCWALISSVTVEFDFAACFGLQIGGFL